MSKIETQRLKLYHTEELLKAFSSSIRSRSLYPVGHPLLRISNERLVDIYEKFFENEDTWTVVLLGGEFVFDKVPLPKVSTFVRPLFRMMDNHKIESITVRKGIRTEEISSFIHLMQSGQDPWTSNQEVKKEFIADGIEHILIQRVDLPSELPTISVDTDEARDIYSSLKHALSRLYVSMVDAVKTPSLELIGVLKKRLIDAMIEDRFAIVSRLHTRHQPDDLSAHCVNTAIIAFMTGQSMGIDEDMLSDLFMAALLHDIGYADIPPRYENGTVYAAKDTRIYVEHPIRGMGILRNIPGLSHMAEMVAFEHHMQWDGKGFPQIRTKHKMNPASCFVSMASIYDKLMHGIEYTPPEKIPEKMIRLAGIEFEPHLLSNFITSIGVYPPGTYVRLTTDETALVVRNNRSDITRPVCRVITGHDGTEPEEIKQINLLDRDPGTGSYLASVKHSVTPDGIIN